MIEESFFLKKVEVISYLNAYPSREIKPKFCVSSPHDAAGKTFVRDEIFPKQVLKLIVNQNLWERGDRRDGRR